MRQVGPRVVRNTALQHQVDDLLAMMGPINHLCTFGDARGHDERKLLNLCHMARHTRCSDPRDKIFAMRYLATDLPDGVLEADYTKSVDELYIDSAKYYIFERKNLGAILASVRPSSHTSSPQLPSWVPDWQTLFDTPLARFAGNVYHADGNISEPAPSLNCQKLLVYGRVLDRLAFRSLSDLTGDPREFQAYVPTDAESSYEHTIQTKSDAFLGTLIGDYNILFQNGEPIALRGQTLDWSVYDAEASSSSRPESWTRERARSMCLNRAFGTTGTHGYYDLFPTEARLSDIIVVLVGCYSPCVLRYLGDNEYLLLGDCYVHGAMDGQAMANDQDLELFTIV